MSSIRTTLVRAAVAGLFLLLAPITAQAQQVLGTIQGQITDTDSGALPGVTVEVVNSETGLSRISVSDANGRYTARSLQPGTYSVTGSLEGFQTTRQEDLRLLVGQTVDLDLQLSIGDLNEEIVVTSEAPLVETSRSSAADYVTEEEIQSLPISGRDFKEFAYLTPTVVDDPVRGFITMSGQRGIYSGLNVDGTSAKSAFFGYGRGGEATENDGLVIAQESVREFQVVTNGFAPEYGANGGGYINVVTKSGTNTTRGSGFYFFRDDSMAEDLPSSPLDDARGNDGSRPVDEFDRKNWGLSLGGPIVEDQTHYFVSYDQTQRDSPITRSLDTPGIYDLILQRADSEPAFASFLDGFDRNADGSATGLFLRSVDNLILFGKIDHQFSDAVSSSFRVNYTDYERFSTFKDEESEKFEETKSYVGSLVALIGDASVNEFRIQYAKDDLTRLSQRVGEPIEAQIRLRFGDFDSVGKFDFLPIFANEETLEIQDNFSYLFGSHDLKFGISYQQDDLSQLFAGSRDGRYDFRSEEDFLNNNASNVRIYFGSVTNPNYDEKQSLLGVYAQDSWQVNDNLTLNYGLRYGATDNPGDLEHLFPEGREIPDDDNNWAPRFGFAFTPGSTGRDVIRGGVGIFYGRVPSLIFASQVQQNGIFPNFGRVNVGPGDIGFVPLGTSIDNANPPLDAPNSPSFVDPDFEDAETTRFNLGYERELGDGWSTGVDFIYAEGENLLSNVELNRTITFDEFGRPVTSSTRPDSNFNEIFVRRSIGESEYKAVTLKFNKRYNGRYQFQGHYTWSKDEDTDSNERSATGVTVSDPNNVRYDWGLSDRDVENRVVLSGLVDIMWGIKFSGIVEYRSGTPWTANDAGSDFAYCGFGRLGFNCLAPYAVDSNGSVIGRNTERNESITRVDLRLAKEFNMGAWRLDVFGEVFNLLDENSFSQVTGFRGINQRDPSNSEFGVADNLVTTPRQVQLGVRITFN